MTWDNVYPAAWSLHVKFKTLSFRQGHETAAACLKHYRNTYRERERESKRVFMAVSNSLSFLFPPPPIIFVTAMSVISFTSLAYTGFSEIRGKHLQYSKFWNVASPKASKTKQIKLSSRTGMLLLYTPAFLAGLASFVLFPSQDLRFLLLDSALTLHFFKRIFEVQFSFFPVGILSIYWSKPFSMGLSFSEKWFVYCTWADGPSILNPTYNYKSPTFGLEFILVWNNYIYLRRRRGGKVYIIGWFDTDPEEILKCYNRLFRPFDQCL